jgi:hypothetical protein
MKLDDVRKRYSKRSPQKSKRVIISGMDIDDKLAIGKEDFKVFMDSLEGEKIKVETEQSDGPLCSITETTTYVITESETYIRKQAALRSVESHPYGSISYYISRAFFDGWLERLE